MKQEIVARKVVRGLFRDGIITADNIESTRIILMQVYAAGVNEGMKQRTKRRPVAKFSLENGEMLGVYESALAAGRAHGVTKDCISKAALGRTKHSAGFKWKYIPQNRKDDQQKKFSSCGQ